MIWTLDQEPENGIMFRGQSTVRVKNRRGEIGEAKVQYSPCVCLVGPVTEIVDEAEYAAGRLDEPQVIDRRPTFRS